MSAAVAEPTAAPTKGKEYASRRADLRLVLEPQVDQFTPNGNKRAPLPGIAVQFVDHRLVVPLTMQSRKDTVPMMVCEGERKVPSSQIIELLSEHRMLGNAVEGFWEAQLPAPLPSAEDIGRITRMGIELDVDGLIDLIAQEEAGWAREDLLAPARDALERVTATKAQLEERHDEAMEQAKAAGEANVKPKPPPGGPKAA